MSQLEVLKSELSILTEDEPPSTNYKQVTNQMNKGTFERKKRRKKNTEKEF